MKEVTYFCDRCGEEIEDSESYHNLKLDVMMDYGHPKETELCIDCLKSYLNWWNQ